MIIRNRNRNRNFITAIVPAIITILGLSSNSYAAVPVIPDGADVAKGARIDPAATSDLTQAWTQIALLKGILTSLRGNLTTVITPIGQQVMASSVPVTMASNQGTINITDTKLPAAGAIATGTVPPTTTIVGTIPHLFNGTSYDPQQGNLEGTALASAARTVTTNSADITNISCKGVVLSVNVTAVPGAGSIQVILQGKDPVSGLYYSLTAPTAKTTASLVVYIMYPGATAGSGANIGQTQSMILPRTWRVQVIHATTDSYTYSVGYCMLN